MNMQFYLAPLEGVTGYIFRNTVETLFPGSVDKYFSPFLVPHLKKSMSKKEKNEIAPEHNKEILLVPQVLTNQAEDFLRFEEQMHSLGYKEINLNLGCPSSTVVSKGKGSGFLASPLELDAFLSEVFKARKGEISLKTRLGMKDTCEFKELLEVFNKYSLKELIVHPRVREEYYDGLPHRDCFMYAMEHSRNPLCYNGDIWKASDYDGLLKDLQAMPDSGKCCAIMIGRGMVADPSLIRQLKGGTFMTQNEMNAYVRMEEEKLLENMPEIPVLFHLKEVWTYLARQFPDEPKLLKKILKTKKLDDYHKIIDSLF